MAEMATGMLVMIDDAPQCQAFRDRLQALISALRTRHRPPRRARASAIVAQAKAAAGCAKVAAGNTAGRPARFSARLAWRRPPEGERPGFRPAQGDNADDLPRISSPRSLRIESTTGIPKSPRSECRSVPSTFSAENLGVASDADLAAAPNCR
ncbi:MAG: hypothetical protein IPF50_07065 [Proteobacteria bacterium]|nr:hypothetical protein [Pseudomonadota bacterium]